MNVHAFDYDEINNWIFLEVYFPNDSIRAMFRSKMRHFFKISEFKCKTDVKKNK